MRIPRIAKKIGKALFLDHLIDLCRSFLILTGLRLRQGVSVSIRMRRDARSDDPIDIVIPVIDKDSDTLPFVIDSAREYIRHPITNIYLVCPRNSVLIHAIAKEKGCVCVDEEILLPIGKKDIDYSVGGANRAGWLYQQFLKWCGDRFTTEDRYLVLDSDTVLIYPHVFISDGKQVFDYCDEIHKPYFEAIERLLKYKVACPVSFTSHHSLIDKKVMAELKAEIERTHGMAWYEAIMAIIDRSQMSSHSDYDTYGHFYFKNHRETMMVRYWKNKSLPRSGAEELERQKARHSGRYRTLSFHEYRK